MKLTSIHHLIFLFAIYSGLIVEGVLGETLDEDGFCISHCSCPHWTGTCDLSRCVDNCNCNQAMDGCDMPVCTKDCTCNVGGCDMSSCKGFTCNCDGGGCTGVSAKKIVDIVTKVVIPIVAVLVVLFCWWRKRKNRKMAEETAYAPTQTQDQMFPVKQGA